MSKCQFCAHLYRPEHRTVKKLHHFLHREFRQQKTNLLETSTWMEWSITRSAGQTGLIFSGSPPRR